MRVRWLLCLLWTRCGGVEGEDGLFQVRARRARWSSTKTCCAGRSRRRCGLRAEKVKSQKRAAVRRCSFRGRGRCFGRNICSDGAGCTGTRNGVVTADEVEGCRRLRLWSGRGRGTARSSQRFFALDVLLLFNQAEWHVVVAICIEGRRIRHGPVHDPSLELVLCANKVLNLGFGGCVSWCQLVFPVFVCARITPAENALHLFVGPGIEVDGLDSADMDAHTSVDAGATDADKDAKVPACPARICVMVNSVSRC